MQKYIHIGFPKNLSTTLQRDFFPKHPEIMHLGVGVGSNIDYISDEINAACESFLLTSRNRIYKRNESKIIQNFEKHFQIAKDKGFRQTGISAELFSFGFSPDHIDSEIKAERLKRIFKSDTKIILIIRNQIDLLKSLYKESIKIGYNKTYREYIEFCYYFHDRNFISDFFYDETITLYQGLFGKENVSIIPIENYRDLSTGNLISEKNSTKLVSKLCDNLGISQLNLELNHYNKPLSLEQLEEMRLNNNEFRNNFSKEIYGTVNGHRLANYFNNHLQLPLPEFLAQDVLIKNENITRSQKGSKKIDFYKDELIYSKLIDLFKKSNEKLNSIIDLPHQYELNTK